MQSSYTREYFMFFLPLSLLSVLNLTYKGLYHNFHKKFSKISLLKFVIKTRVLNLIHLFFF